MRGSKSNGSKHTNGSNGSNGSKPTFKLSQLRAGALALLVAILAAPALLPSDEPGECPHDEAACAFAGSYEAARAQFRSLSRASGASLFSLPIASNGTWPPLSIDVALFGAQQHADVLRLTTDDSPLLVHVSGTHGAEGYSGSAVQLALLRRWAADPAARPAGVRVALVHALNPFGFHHGRRWNEDGVDLNRNLLTDAEFARLTAEGEERHETYVKLVKPIVDWDAPYSVVGEARMWVGFLTAIAANGFTAMKKALVSGQYRCAGCCFYGGASLSASHASLLQWLGEQTPSARSVIFLDVHTGLGPRGVDTLSSHQTKGPDQQADAMLEAIFGNASNGDVADRDFILDIAGSSGNLNGPAAKPTALSDGSYEVMLGGTGEYLPRMRAGWARALHVTQEFGTRPGILVARAMAIESAEWRHRGGTPLGARTMRDAFYVRTGSWQRAVVRRGVEAVAQALKALADDGVAGRLPPNA